MLRLLALHGFVQNSAVFRERTGSLRKAVKGVAELFFVDAPHSAAGAFPDSDKTALGGGDDGDVRGWWLAGENQSDNSEWRALRPTADASRHPAACLLTVARGAVFWPCDASPFVVFLSPPPFFPTPFLFPFNS